MKKNNTRSTLLSLFFLTAVIGAPLFPVSVHGEEAKPPIDHSMDNMKSETDQCDMAGHMQKMNDMLKMKSGDEFDKAFLSHMIMHHQGAIDMAMTAKANAKHDEIKKMAQDIIQAQTQEIEKMKEEAEKNADKDKEEKEKIEVKNKADNKIYVAEKSLKDAGDKAPKDIKENVEKKIKELKNLIGKGTKDEMEQKTKDLSDELAKIGQAMYNKQTPPQPGQEVPKEEKKSSSAKASEDKGKVEEGQVVN